MKLSMVLRAELSEVTFWEGRQSGSDTLGKRAGHGLLRLPFSPVPSCIFDQSIASAPRVNRRPSISILSIIVAQSISLHPRISHLPALLAVFPWPASSRFPRVPPSLSSCAILYPAVSKLFPSIHMTAPHSMMPRICQGASALPRDAEISR